MVITVFPQNFGSQSTKTIMNDNDFLEAIEAEPANAVPRLVYADWLDNQGDPRGELLRIQEELRHLNVPRRAEKEARMHELLNEGVEPLMVTRTNSIGMQEVLIFPGEFLMGSPANEEGQLDNENQVEVRLTQGFWLGKYTVKQAEWQQIIGNRPWEEKDYVRDAPDCPVTFVSWEDAMDFCRRLTEKARLSGRLPDEWKYTLPTEAQWEYACRCGTTTAYSFGDDSSKLGDYVWFADNADDVGEEYPHAVGTKAPNPWELSDLHGNVGEWCRDWYADNLPGGPDPEVTVKGWGMRVSRGGCWFTSARDCRSACRGGYWPDGRGYGLGFRVATVQVR